MKRLFVVLCLFGCSSDPTAVSAYRIDAPASESASLALTAAPFPNDVHRVDGRLHFAADGFPFRTTDGDLALLATAMNREDCFGSLSPGLLFPLSVVDEDDISGDAAVHLYELPSGSEIAVDVHYRSSDALLYARPKRGTLLSPGKQYVATVDRGLTGKAGPVARAPLLDRWLAGDVDPRTSAALDPARPYVNEDTVSATSFTVCRFGQDLVDARAQLVARAAPSLTIDHVYQGEEGLAVLLGKPTDPASTGLDAAGGVAHAHLNAVILGRIPSPNYRAAKDDGQGRFERGHSGELIVKSTASVPVLLSVPKERTGEALPLIVFQHGLTGSRSSALALANKVAAHGFAVLAPDMPFHGNRRSNARDDRGNFTGRESPDGLADTSAPAIVGFFNASGDGDTKAFDTRAITDNFVQAAVDLMATADFAARGELALPSPLDTVSLDATRIVLSAESLGGLAAVISLAHEERYGAAFLAVTGGGLASELLTGSPQLGSVLGPLIEGKLGVAPNEVQENPPATHPMYIILDQLVARGDPQSYAPLVRERGPKIFLPVALDDEVVPNAAQETLASGLGLRWLRGLPGTTEGPQTVDASVFTLRNAPLSDGGAIAAFKDATHLLFTWNGDSMRWERGYPFRRRENRVWIDNPIHEVQNLLVEFAKSYRATGTPTVGERQ